ncbi:MAG TPA: G1 family glutamic endopeptidase [Candidatus Dormibacteraeota bacterium]
MTGIDGVPGDATAVCLNVTVTDATSGSYLSVFPAGGSVPLVSNVNWGRGQTVPNLVVVPVGNGGQVSFYNDLGDVDVVADLEGYYAPESGGSTVGSYVALNPARIADTRSGGQPLGPGDSLDIQVTGEGGVPSTVGDVEAALLNVTVTDTTSGSYLTVFPQGGTAPLASNLNWVQGQTVPNRVAVKVGATGEITVYNDSGNVDVIVDVDGYFTAGSTAPAGAALYTAISPTRLVDTRAGSGAFGAGGTLGGKGTITEPLASLGSLGSNVTAMVTNVTTTDTTSGSFLTVYPGPTLPPASDLNWSTRASTQANLTIATVDTDGNVTFFNDLGSADVIVDVFGYFSSTPTLDDTGYLTSTNWSGYEEDNGAGTANDTGVTGTFTIPALYDGQSPDDYMSEWVGIDGWTNGNLIQAGIVEEPDTSTTFYLDAWWEILPATAVYVDASFPNMAPGDVMTINIHQVSGTTWEISMDDVTENETFTSDETYNPSGTTETSAEWIVEAPDVGGSTAPLADYTPTTFSGLSVQGTDSEQTEIALFQGSDYVSVPSGPAEGGTSFNVDWGDVIPLPPS